MPVPNLSLVELAALIQSPSARQELAGADRLKVAGPETATTSPQRPPQQSAAPEPFEIEFDGLGGGDWADLELPAPRPSPRIPTPSLSPQAREAARFRVDRGRPPSRPFRSDLIEGAQGGPMQEVGRVGRFPVLAPIGQRPPREASGGVSEPVQEPSPRRQAPEPPVRRKTSWEHLLDDDD